MFGIAMISSIMYNAVDSKVARRHYRDLRFSCRLILGKIPNSMRCQQRIQRLMIPRFDHLCIGDDAWARNEIKVGARLYSRNAPVMYVAIKRLHV